MKSESEKWALPTVLRAAVIGILGITQLAACSDSNNRPLSVDNTLDDGKPCGSPQSFVNPQSGAAAEIGIRFSREFLSCLIASEEEYIWVLDVSEKGALSEPFNHAFVQWNPAGHPPPMVYEIPHMDVHFHMATPEEREGYCNVSPDQVGCLVLPGPDEVPPGYLPGEPAAGHGVHWLPSMSPEFTPDGFSTTLIYGSYDGDMIFIEPMVTGEFLMSSPAGAQSFPVPQPAAVGRTGGYPQNYEIRFDEALQQYEILLTDFQFREAP